MERALIFSSDGHAVPRMRDYRDYLPQRMHESFDEYCDFWDEHGALTLDPAYLQVRLDADVLEDWKRRLFDAGRLEGCHDPVKRVAELEREGIAGEVLFPDTSTLRVDLTCLTPASRGVRAGLRAATSRSTSGRTMRQ